MKKQITLLLAAIVFMGFSSQAQAQVPDCNVLNEWTFDTDLVDTLLSVAANTGTAGATFSLVSGIETILKTDGSGILSNTTSAASLWGDGATLDANVTDPSSGVRYMRYDLKYDLTHGDHEVGTTIGISFVNTAGTEVAGMALVCSPVGSDPAPSGMASTVVVESLPLSGTLSAIAEVDLGARTIKVWYDSAAGNELLEKPDQVVSNILLASIGHLRIRSTGDVNPGEAGDFVNVDMIRTANCWDEIAGIPNFLSVSTNELTIRVAPGEMASGTLTLSNTGNAPAAFSVIDDGRLPLGGYQVVTQNTSMVSFGPADFSPDTVFPGWNGESTDTLDIGFEFGTTAHDAFFVHEQGAVALGGGGESWLVITPFWRDLPFEKASIRYQRMIDGRLVIAWGNGTAQEMQAWLYPDGTIRFLYNYGTWGDGLISFTALSSQVWYSAEYGQMISHIPGQTGNDSLLLTPKSSWVSYGPSSGTVFPEGSQDLTLIADASGFRPREISTFDLTVHWAGGGSDVVTVTVLVEEKTSALGFPFFFSFEGPAGCISPPSYMTVTNTGNTTLDYTIIDSGMAGAGYIPETAAYEWFHIPLVVDFMLYAADLGVAPVEIGFPFAFFGATYTSMIVGADGTLYLGDTASIVPFSAGLSLDGNASVRVFTNLEQTRCTVTWENMAQLGGSNNQTFQAMLYRDGSIRFNYKWMGDGWPDGDILLGDGQTVMGTLSNETTTSVEKVLVNETNMVPWFPGFPEFGEEEVVTVIGTNEVVTFTDSANGQAIEFAPGEQRIITFSPESGTILPGKTADIRLIGDARRLTSGGSADTRLTFLTQPPTQQSLVLVDDADDLDWEKVSYNVYLLSKNAGAAAPLPGKPSVVYFDGKPVEGLPDGTTSSSPGPWWSWVDSGKGWYTLQVRLKWVSDDEFFHDPDNREEGFLEVPPISAGVGVNFTATNSTETAYPDPAVQAAMWGFADPVVSSQQNPDGSRTLSWPPAEDGLSRIYTVWCTTSLSSPWNLLATLSNLTSYIDSKHNDEPVIFYKVTVQ